MLLVWQDNSDNENGFEVERSINEIDFGLLDTTAANASYYWDHDIESGQTYYYRVRAFNDYGNSDYSNVDSVTIP